MAVTGSLHTCYRPNSELINPSSARTWMSMKYSRITQKVRQLLFHVVLPHYLECSCLQRPHPSLKQIKKASYIELDADRKNVEYARLSSLHIVQPLTTDAMSSICPPSIHCAGARTCAARWSACILFFVNRGYDSTRSPRVINIWWLITILISFRVWYLVDRRHWIAIAFLSALIFYVCRLH